MATIRELNPKNFATPEQWANTVDEQDFKQWQTARDQVVGELKATGVFNPGWITLTAETRKKEELERRRGQKVWGTFFGKPLRGEDGRKFAEKMEALDKANCHPQC